MIVHVIKIEDEPPRPCEYCGEVDECRPYGVNGNWICFPCSQLPENIELAERLLHARLEGRKPVGGDFTIEL